jgi:PAS domain S-box-containing protein
MKNSRISSLIVASIVLTIGMIALTYYQIENNREANGWIVHTYEVINQSNELLSLVKDAETGQRGYLITSDTSYLKPFLEAEKNLKTHILRLKDLVSDNPAQLALVLEKEEPFIDLKISILKKAIVIHDQFGQDSAIARVKDNGGKKAMDSIRLYTKKIVDREYVLLADRTDQLAKFYSIIDPVRYVSLITIILISFFGLIALVRRQKQNKGLVDRLRKFTYHLEKRVHQRTQELEVKNETSERTNEELAQTMEEVKSFYEALQVQNATTEDALIEIRDLYEYSPCGYHSLNEDGIFLRINSTELSWLGYTREELVGKMKFKNLLAPKSLENWQAQYDEYKIKGSVANVELQLIRKNGTTFPVVLNSSALYDARGKFIMSRSTTFDLSQRKKMEHQLKEANEKLTKVNQEKNTFLGMASHDLKSPLNSVLGLINLLKVDSENLTDDQKENLSLIFNSARQMKAMIDKLLDLNRIEFGRSLIQKTELEFVGLVKKNIDTFKEGAAKKEIQIIFEANTNTLAISSDPTVLNQILDNLISNALKFSSAKKRIWVSISVNEESIVVDVRDEGPGIKPQEFHKLFGKFQKLSARPTGGETSTGLGLSIVKELVQTLEGHVSCQSTLGVGTTFTVKFPLEKFLSEADQQTTQP